MMKIEYDPVQDLLYISFGDSGQRVAETVTVCPGVHADFSRGGKLVGLEVIDASDLYLQLRGPAGQAREKVWPVEMGAVPLNRERRQPVWS